MPLLGAGWKLEEILDLNVDQIAFVANSIVMFTRIKLGLPIDDMKTQDVDPIKDWEKIQKMGMAK